MKTLAVIKNELFKDYLRFVSTSDLPSVLDNPDIPVPFTCVEAVDNQNSDALMAQLKSYFNNSKVGNKDFYTLDDDTTAQLQFMFNLIKLSSGQAASEVTAQAPSSVSNATSATQSTPVNQHSVADNVVTSVEPTPAPSVATQVEPVVTVAEVKDTPSEKVVEPAVVSQPVSQPAVATVAKVTAPVVEEVKEPTPEVAPTVTPDVTPVVTPVINPAAQEEVSVFAEDDADPFGFKTAPASQVEQAVEAPSEKAVEPAVVLQPVVQPAVETVAEVTAPVVEELKEVASTVETIASLGIPKGAEIHFIKDENITATLVDEKTVNYDNQNMTLVEAAKAAFKKSGTVGMAVGLSNWNYAGETLKAWKEKQLN